MPNKTMRNSKQALEKVVSEKEMILKGLIAEQQGKLIDHDALWKKLLNTPN
jgi:hypothetical protein